jgi:RNA polymerase sigma-70 factor (ECF subfamily)
MNTETPSTTRTRVSLILQVRNWEDSVSWREFYRLYGRLVSGFARRAGLSHAEADDVTQDVFKRVAQTIHSFDPERKDGSFRGWLLQLARWRIADKFKSRPKAENQSPRRSETEGGGRTRTRTVERVPEPDNAEEQWNREWQLRLVDAAADRVARRVKPEHYQAFDLYMRQNWPVPKVCAKLGLTPASVYLIGHRLTRQLKAEVAKLQSQLD